VKEELKAVTISSGMGAVFCPSKGFPQLTAKMKQATCELIKIV